MARQWIFVLCASAFLGVRADDDLSDFSNNLASDIGPLLVLFGESMTKQYLSESTSFLDYFIFAMAPIGIITAIVSTIRVCGHSSLRAFIGRSQEGDGVVEAELCTSTSRDVCEMFNRGGITRVLGKPDILELVYLPCSGSLRLFRNYLDEVGRTEHPDNSWWQREDSSLFGKAKDPHGKGPSFAPNPNLSLNVGIVKQPDWVVYAIAATGLVLQSGVLALAGIGVWILGWNLNEAESSASRDYAPAMFITGTVIMCGGMWSCAALIGQTTHELRFRRTKLQDAAKRPRLLWLQPGPQVIGDQSFDPFAYFEDPVANPIQVWTSSRKDFDEKFETYTFFAVLAVLIGYLMQFIGLRGMTAWVSLAQLGITLVMSVLRGCLRMQRLGKSDNMLLTMPDMITGHELDWLSFEIVGAEDRTEGGGKGEEMGRKWREKGGEEEKEGKVWSWHVTGQYEEAVHVETQGRGSRRRSESRRPSSGIKEIQSEVDVQLALTEPQDGFGRGLDGMELLLIRKQLAHLTGNNPFDTVSGHQEWGNTRVKVRAKAVELCDAICQAAESLWKRRQWKHQPEDISQRGQQEQDATLRIRAAASPNAKQANSHEPLIDIALKPPNAYKPGWRMDSAQLEAILGLWMWTLASDERVVSEDGSHQKISDAEDVQRMRIVSAGSDDNNWGRESNKQGEMDLWLGSNAVPLLENSLTLTEQSCHGIAALWAPHGENNWELIRRDSACLVSQMRRLSGWHSIHGLVRPVASDSTSMSGQQENRRVKLRVQVTPAGGSLLDLCAQELFASLMMSLMGILTVESTTIDENAGLMRLKNPTLATFAEAFAERGLGSYSDALLCLVPAFRTKFPLPSSEDMLSVLLRAAEAYRKTSEWDRAQTMLRWACARHAPSRGEEEEGEENPATTLGNRDSFTRALRATGELYRWSLVAQHSSDERKNFGRSGIKWMAESYRFAGPSNPEVTEILDCYEAVAQRIATASADTNSLPTRRIQEVAGHLVQAMRDKNRTDALYYLCFVKTGDFGFEPLQPALPLAVRNDWSEVVNAVLEMKAGLNSQDEGRRTALSYCAEFGRESYVKLLVDRGAFLDQPDDKQRTPLLLAFQLGHGKVIELLLNTGHVNVEVTEEDGRTLLSQAAERGQEAVVRLLLKKGANIEAKDHNGRTPLSWAAEHGQEAVARLLLKKGANIESKDRFSRTPLSRAAERGQEAVVRLLLEEGATTELKDHSSWTPLSWAAERRHKAVVRLLLEKGANTESGDHNGRTPLSRAAICGREAEVRLLLEKGANTESEDRNSQTALSWAAERGQEAIVRLLLKEGANIESKDQSGLTALSRAAVCGYEAVVRLLLEEGANIESVDKGGRTPLSWAAERGQEAVIRLLLEKCVNIESKDKGGRTPLSYATEHGKEAVVRLLQPKSR